MTQLTPNLQLKEYDRVADKTQLFIDYRDDQAGTGSSSNMSKIDAFAGNIQNEVTGLKGTGWTNQTVKSNYDLIQATNQKVTYTTTVTGTDTLVGTISELTSISNNLNMFIIPTATNTGVTTLNMNNTGALPIVKVQNWTGSTVYAPLEAGDLTPNIPVLIKKSPDGLRYFLNVENSASHIYYKNGTNNYTNLQTKLATLDAGIPINTSLSFSPTTITKTGVSSSPVNLTFIPRHIINGLGKIGGFYKDSNSDGLADGWTGTNTGTFSLSNGEQTTTPTAVGGNLATTITTTASRTLFLCSRIKSLDNTAKPDLVGQTSLASKTNSGSNVYEKCGQLSTTVGTSISAQCFVTAKTSTWNPITVKQAFYVDVTDYPELVGLTNQQKLDWCLANLEYSDGIGVTKNPTVKITHPDSSISYTTAQGDFLTGDEISILNNKTFGNKLWSSKKVLYGKDYDLINWGDYSGFKSFAFNQKKTWGNTTDSNNLMQKYDGSLLVFKTPLDSSNQFLLEAEYLYITVSDSETGFSESVNPTNDEVKAFFNGWKKTGASTWVSVVDGITTPTVQSIDYVKSNIAPNYDGYQLYYKYTTPKPINEDSDSYLAPLKGDVPTLKQGVNTVTMDTGIVLGEIANPITDSSFYYINNNYSPLYASRLQNPMSSITKITKNGVDDTSNWTIPSGSAFDNGVGAKISISNYDTTAIYKVYGFAENSPKIGSCSSSYAEGLVDSVSGIYEMLPTLQKQNVVLDTIVDLAMYEKVSARRVNCHWFSNGVSFYVRVIIPISKKIVRPVVKVDSVSINRGNGFGDVTPNFTLHGIEVTMEQVSITYISTDATVATDIKANGVTVFMGITADCRGVI